MYIYIYWSFNCDGSFSIDKKKTKQKRKERKEKEGTMNNFNRSFNSSGNIFIQPLELPLTKLKIIKLDAALKRSRDKSA